MSDTLGPAVAFFLFSLSKEGSGCPIRSGHQRDSLGVFVKSSQPHLGPKVLFRNLLLRMT